MNTAQLNKKIAKLESVHDQLETELRYVDSLLKSVGFPNGIESAKAVALEMLENQEDVNDERIEEKEDDEVQG